MNPPVIQKKIAIIGAGISGIVCAQLLSRKHDVTVFEKNNYIGGHTSTIELTSGPDAGIAVDTGFIVLNDTTYPNFHEFLKLLDVEWRYADMSFSVWSRKTNLQYGSKNLSTLFAQKKNLFSPYFWSLLVDIKKFWKKGAAALLDETIANKTLKQFLDKGGFGIPFREDFLLPLGAAIWSTPSTKIGEFPAKTFLTFFKNHGYLNLFGQPRWQTVVGGSFSYVKAFLAQFKGSIHANANIVGVKRDGEKHIVILAEGRRELFDEIILACHADEARSLVQDPTPAETNALQPWQYNINRTLLHTDASLMPPLRASWASWNYTKEIGESGEEPVCITYDMNRLQGLKAKEQYFVTLNPRREPKNILREFHYTHPIYLPSSVAAQETLQKINGQAGRWYAGAYLGFGFHEDGVKSALAVCKHFGETI